MYCEVDRQKEKEKKGKREASVNIWEIQCSSTDLEKTTAERNQVEGLVEQPGAFRVLLGNFISFLKN